jgi:hypothetical protein
MTTARQVCPVHTDEDIAGKRINDEGTYEFTCVRRDRHPVPGPYTWMQAPEPPDLQTISGLAAELGLDVELPHAIGQYAGRWVEYGVVEHTYATANPKDFAALVERYGHTAIAPARYTASAFLAATLGHLSRTGHVLYHPGPATGRWEYNGQISWWAVPPAPDWEDRTSWVDLALRADHVPGSAE